jgi:hypothetical protein
LLAEGGIGRLLYLGSRLLSNESSFSKLQYLPVHNSRSWQKMPVYALREYPKNALGLKNRVLVSYTCFSKKLIENHGPKFLHSGTFWLYSAIISLFYFCVFTQLKINTMLALFF